MECFRISRPGRLCLGFIEKIPLVGYSIKHNFPIDSLIRLERNKKIEREV